MITPASLDMTALLRGKVARAIPECPTFAVWPTGQDAYGKPYDTRHRELVSRDRGLRFPDPAVVRTIGAMRPPERSTPDLHRVLVSIDPSANATAALDVAARLARSTHATVTLLAVAPLAAVPTDEPAFGVPMQEPQDQHLLDRLAQERVDDVAAALGSGLDVRTRLGWGSAGRAIVEEAAEGDHDLVVIPWHQNGPIGHFLHEHNHAARHVLDHCPVPVVLVPAGRAETAR